MGDIGSLPEITDVEGRDETMVRDRSESSISKQKRSSWANIFRRGGVIAEGMTSEEQLNWILRLGARLIAVTHENIGGRLSTAYRVTDNATWSAYPTITSEDSTNEKRGHAVFFQTRGEVSAVRIAASTVYAAQGISRRNLFTLYEVMRRGDLLQFTGWTDNRGGNPTDANILILQDPVYDATTDSFLFTVKPFANSGITADHILPGAVTPTFGISVGIGGISIPDPLPVSRGGTGAQNSIEALNNLLPSGIAFPENPDANQLFVLTRQIGSGTWDAGIDLPSNTTAVGASTVDAQGRVVISPSGSGLGGKLFRLENEAWSELAQFGGQTIGGTRILNVTSEAMTILPDGSIVFAVQSSSRWYFLRYHADGSFTQNGVVWNGGGLFGLAYYNNIWYMAIRDGSGWSVRQRSGDISGENLGNITRIANPPGVDGNSPRNGLTIRNGRLIQLAQSTGSIRTYRLYELNESGAWDIGFNIPTTENSPDTIAVLPDGSLIVIGSATNKLYTYTFPMLTGMYIRRADNWEALAT